VVWGKEIGLVANTLGDVVSHSLNLLESDDDDDDDAVFT